MSSSQKSKNQNQKQCLADGVFVAAPKRPYCEYVFDIKKDKDGILSKRKPRRRGPLDDSTAQRIEAVKQEGGACWRCKVLKKPCDPGSPCKQCETKSGKLWKIGCRRGSLHHLLDDVCPDIPGFGSPEWYLPTLNGDFLRIRVTHDNPEHKFRDLDLSALWSTPELHYTDLKQLQNFLTQFHDVDFYFPSWLNPEHQQIITLSVKIQWDMVSQSPIPSSKWPESTLLIALTLRALAQWLELCEFGDRLITYNNLHSFSKPEIIKDDNSTIEVLRFSIIPETPSTRLGPDGDVQLPLLTQEIVRIIQQVLLKRHPPDWPGLLCVLGLLQLVKYTTWLSVSLFHPPDDMHKIFSKVVHDLMELYVVCTKGIHPLTGEDARQSYALIARDNQLAVTHFNLLNDVWNESEMCFLRDDNFKRKIELWAGYG